MAILRAKTNICLVQRFIFSASSPKISRGYEREFSHVD